MVEVHLDPGERVRACMNVDAGCGVGVGKGAVVPVTALPALAQVRNNVPHVIMRVGHEEDGDRRLVLADPVCAGCGGCADTQ